MPQAEPILASTLWTFHLAASTKSPPTTPGKLAIGISDVDTALAGGLEYGRITAISADPSSGDAQLLSHALLVSHLLASEGNVATVIDSTLAFDLKSLHQRLVNALQDGVDGKVMEALDWLKIMKVFDFVGLTECIGEVREGLDDGKGEERHATASMRENRTRTTGPRGTVSDSEDDGNEVVSPPKPCKSSAPVQPDVRKPSQHLLVIDNIAQLVAPLLKNNHAQGQALLKTFMRSLSHLTKRHNICTVLFNNTTIYAASKEESPSIFSSCAQRPAFGKAFTYALDVHLLVHTVPKTAEDARAVYGGVEHGKEKGGVQMVSVMEVLQDRYEGRMGRWAAFSEMSPDVRERNVVRAG